MLILRDVFGFGNLTRVLIVALSLGFGLGAPIDAVQPAGCALVGDCAVSPVEEPRERVGLSLSFALSSGKKQPRVVSTAVQAAPQVPSPIAATPFGERRDLPDLRGREHLPDKTGPPSA